MVGLILVAALLPIAWLLFSAGADNAEGNVGILYRAAALVPLAGAAFAMAALAVILGRRSRPVLRVGPKEVFIARTRTRFASDQLARVEVFSQPGDQDFMALLPASQVQLGRSAARDRHVIKDYLVAFPEGANYRPFELAELLGTTFPGVEVVKLGSLGLSNL